METILIVDDNKDMQYILSSILKNEGYETLTVGDGKQALDVLNKKSPDLVLLDMKLPGIDGIQILKKMKQIDNDLIVIILTAYGDVKGAVRAMKLGAFDYIIKPFDNEEIVLVIKKALQTQYLSKEVDSLRKRLGEKKVIEKAMGESSQIKHVLNQIKIVAPTNMTVVLQGESGTGKELIAHMIHQESPRKYKPFIAIDCGAIPETLIESTLFGYEKGAFTGADAQKEGEFEQANGGTLFLDEIANFSDGMQMKLLRVIQERKLRHLSGKKNIKIDVRIIVATNVDLYDAVKQGKFRLDLFHRINEFHIILPTLSERKDDIHVLAKYFLNEANNELAKNIKGFSSDAMKLLLNYYWPGNVRELRNIVRRAVLLTESDYIPADLIFTNDIKKSQSEIDLTGELKKGVSFEDITKRVEKDLVKNAIEQAGGNKVQAAKILQINRKALYRKIKRLGL